MTIKESHLHVSNDDHFMMYSEYTLVNIDYDFYPKFNTAELQARSVTVLM